MKISLIENGLDSLKKGFEYLKNYEEKFLLEQYGTDRYFLLKDAILAIHHGIEILFKEVLRRANEFLIFSEINKKLKKACVQKRQQGLYSLFETDQVLHTVTFRESIDRVEKICGYEINDKFLKKLIKIEDFRNRITHSEVILDEVEVNQVLEGLVDEIDTFFIKSMGKEYTTITGYDKLKENYKKYLDSLSATKRKIKKETIEKYLEAFEKCSISMGENEVKIIKDINQTTTLIETLYNSNLKFGTDLYDGCCSGDVSKIRRIEDDRFAIFTKDNLSEYWVKFGSLLIFMPKISSDFSPIIILEACDDQVHERLKKYVQKDSDNRNIIEGIKVVKEDKIIWNPKDIHEFCSRSEYDEYYRVPEHYSIRHYLSKGIFCFINIQMLNYGNMASILSNFGTESLKKIEVMLRKSINEEV